VRDMIILAAVAGLIALLAAGPGGPLSRHLPKHRVRWMRIRLHLRMKPVHGHATLFELFWHFGRWASWRESKRTRPGLTRSERATSPKSHSFFIGWAHWFIRIRATIQEHGLAIGPPRAHKSALLSHIVLDAPGSVVCTSSKPDLFFLTAAWRSTVGPVFVFNPGGIGDVPSNVFWSPLDGCLNKDGRLNAAVAIRRADQFASAASTAGAEDAQFWSAKASDGMRGLLAAAVVAGLDMRQVGRWVGTASETPQAVAVLHNFGLQDWAAQVAELNGPAEKTSGTIRMVMSRALGFMADPQLAAAVLPGPGQGFDIDQFLLRKGTLYMMARASGQDSPLAPLFAALACEIQHRAVQLGSLMKGNRLDPPLTMVLDEVTQICPVPAPTWMADSGGQGISLWLGMHGRSQLMERWGVFGAQTIIDCANCLIYTSGIKDVAALDDASKLAGSHAMREHGQDQVSRIETLTADMIRRLPNGFALIIRDRCAPVIVRLAKGWKHKGARRMARQHLAFEYVAAAAAVAGPDQMDITWSEQAAERLETAGQPLAATGAPEREAMPWQ
jgi:type IV secretion system protein VirD4